MTRRLACWIAPEAVLGAAQRLKDDRDAALATSAIVIASSVLTKDRDGGLTQLTRDYLRRFHIPVKLIALLRATSPEVPLAVWDELVRIRFSGQVESPHPHLVIPNANPVLVICDRDIVVDILTQPLQGLQGIVATAAENWFRMAEAGLSSEQVFLRHASADPFGVWMDATVAAHCGFPGVAEHTLGKMSEAAINSGYRRVTIVGWQPGSEKLTAACRDAAHAQAAQTREPISGRIA
jgi:hypothetical protein